METKVSPVHPTSAPPQRLVLWAVLVAMAWLFAGALYLSLPPSPDQFNLAYMGWRWLSGDVPYVELIDVNWPGVIGLHALATWLFGNHLWTWRAFDFLMFAVTAVFLAGLVRRAAGSSAAWACAFISPLLYVGAGYWMAGQHDMSAAQFLVLALWCHGRGYEARQWPWQLGTGLLLAAAMLCKPTVGVMLPLLALQALLLGEAWRRVAGHTLVVALALGATIGATVLVLLQRGSALADLREVMFVFVLANQYVDDAIAKDRSLLDWWFRTQARRWGELALAAVPAVVWSFRRGNASIATTALPLLWLTGVLSYFVQARGLGYHLTPSFLALIGMVSVSIGVLAAGPRGTARPGLRRVAFYGLVLAVLAGAAYRLVLSYRALPGAWASGDWSRHLGSFYANDGITVNDAVALARLAEADPSANCLLVVGDGSAINYLARLKQPTRFYYFPVIARTGPPLPMAERWLALWASDLKAADCPLAMVSREVHDGWLNGPSPAADALRRFLEAYAEAGVSGGPDGGLLIYRRR